MERCRLRSHFVAIEIDGSFEAVRNHLSHGRWRNLTFVRTLTECAGTDSSSHDIPDAWERKVGVAVNNGLTNLGGIVYHIPGAINPSDAASRGVWKGPVDHEADRIHRRLGVAKLAVLSS